MNAVFCGKERQCIDSRDTCPNSELQNFYPHMNIFSHNNEGTHEERGDDAIRTFKAGAELIGAILGTTLGPKGAMKIMQGPQSVSVTNDGATILKNLVVDNPAAKILINASISQDWEEGDGTTSVSVLASLLIEEAYKLKIHPIKVIEGYQLALEKIKEELLLLASDATEEDLLNLARTTICSKVLKCNLDLFSKMCLEAVSRLGDSDDLNMIQIIKSSGKLEESFLSDGFILKKDQHIDEKLLAEKNTDQHEAAPGEIRVLTANTSLDTDKIKIFGAKINVNSISKLSDIEEAERNRMREKIDRICSVPIKVFINRQLIYDYPLELFREKGVIAIEHADFDGVERLTKFLGGRIMSTFDKLDDEHFGSCTKVANVLIGNERMIKFEKKGRNASTIILRGSSQEVLDEAERSIHDALCVLNKIRHEKKVVCGGGATEMELALCLGRYALEFPGKESESIIAFSNALQRIPMIICENGGFDGEEIKARMRSEHFNGNKTAGVNMANGSVECMRRSGIVESLRIKRRIIAAAVEVAQMVIKCDGFIKHKPRERTRE